MRVKKRHIWSMLLCFALSFCGVFAKSSSVSEGIYILESAANPGKVLDVDGGSVSDSAALQLYEKNCSDAQKFYIYKTNDGYFKIRPICSGKLLTCGSCFEDNKKFSKTGIYQRRFNDSDYQKWIFEDSGKGGYYIICKANDLIMGFGGAGGKIKLWKQDINKGQRFRLKPIKTFNSDGYIISTDKNDMQIDKMQVLFKSLGKSWSKQKFKKIIDKSSMCFGVLTKKVRK